MSTFAGVVVLALHVVASAIESVLLARSGDARSAKASHDGVVDPSPLLSTVPTRDHDGGDLPTQQQQQHATNPGVGSSSSGGAPDGHAQVAVVPVVNPLGR